MFIQKIVATFIFSICMNLLYAQAPMLINYQGKLNLPDNIALSDTNLNFYIFTDSSGNNSIWNKEYNDVQYQNGIFNLLLGPFENNEFNSNEECWLETRINNTLILKPRFKLVSVPYAIHSNSANILSASDGDPVDAVVVDNEGNVGIGTNAPSQKLSVNGYVASQTVAFSAYVADDFQIGNIDRLPMTVVSNNIGGYYDPDSSVFTAPVKGVYLFTMTGNSNGINTSGGDHLEWRLKVNDDYANSGQQESNQRGRVTWYLNNITSSRTVILQLISGDRITIEQFYDGSGSGKCGDFTSGLEGILLFAQPDTLQ